MKPLLLKKPKDIYTGLSMFEPGMVVHVGFPSHQDHIISFPNGKRTRHWFVGLGISLRPYTQIKHLPYSWKAGKVKISHVLYVLHMNEIYGLVYGLDQTKETGKLICILRRERWEEIVVKSQGKLLPAVVQDSE